MTDFYYEQLRVGLHVEKMGEDLCATVSGGDKPHIGSIAIAEPRQSLLGNGSRSSTVSTYNFVGHKDGEVANAMAHELAARLNCKVVVVCGLHYDKVSEKLFEQVNQLTVKMVEDIIAAV